MKPHLSDMYIFEMNMALKIWFYIVLAEYSNNQRIAARPKSLALNI